ncbi:DNA primase [Streptomyces sp. NPDC002920]
MNGMGLGLALGAGYLLGRTKKLKFALALGSLAAGKKLNLTPGGVAELVSQQLRDNPQFKELGEQLREDLQGVGKAASGAMVERRMESLADRLHDRTSKVRDQLSGVVPEDEEEPDEETPVDEEPDEEEPEEAEPDEEAADEEEPAEAEQAESAEEDEEPEEPEEAEEDEAKGASGGGDRPRRKRTAQKTAPKKPARKAPAKTPAKKAPARGSAGKKTAARKKTTASRARSAKGGEDR